MPIEKVEQTRPTALCLVFAASERHAFPLVTNLLQCSCSVCALCRLSACLLVMLSCEGRPVRPHYEGPAQTRVLEALSERQILMSRPKACKETVIEECLRVWSVSLRACSLQCCASSVHEPRALAELLTDEKPRDEWSPSLCNFVHEGTTSCCMCGRNFVVGLVP